MSTPQGKCPDCGYTSDLFTDVLKHQHSAGHGAYKAMINDHDFAERKRRADAAGIHPQEEQMASVPTTPNDDVLALAVFETARKEANRLAARGDCPGDVEDAIDELAIAGLRIATRLRAASAQLATAKQRVEQAEESLGDARKAIIYWKEKALAARDDASRLRYPDTSGQ